MVMKESSLIRKIRLVSKFMSSRSAKHEIAIHILPNISKSKGNQTMKSGQFRENFFWEIHTKNVVEKLFSDPSLKN